MDPYGQGYPFGKIIGSIAAPLVLAALIVLVYEKLRKRQIKRKKLVTVALWIIIFVLATLGKQVGKEQTAPAADLQNASTTVAAVTQRGVALADGWAYYEFPDVRFGLAFPAPPTRVDKELPDGTALVSLGVSSEGGALLVNSYRHVGEYSDKEKDDFLHELIAGGAEGVKGRVASERKTTFKAFRAREYSIVGESNKVRGVAFVMEGAGEQRIFNLATFSPKEGGVELPYERFIGSFKALAP